MHGSVGASARSEANNVGERSRGCDGRSRLEQISVTSLCESTGMPSMKFFLDILTLIVIFFSPTLEYHARIRYYARLAGRRRGRRLMDSSRGVEDMAE